MLAGRYRTTEILGHGGMGEVYHGYDELLGRSVAVKLLRPDLRDPFAAARFQREARAAAVVKHPHVVAVYDFGHSNGEYYLVMELVEGRSVTHELALHGPLSPERAVGIVREAAAGLDAAHRHDIVHRDIKPDNLLIDVDGSVKVADFGIARSPGSSTLTTTESGTILGTSYYLAPERALGRSATPASDVYALGCVLYQLLVGRPPFEGDDPTTILYQHVEVEPAVPADLPAPVRDLLRTLLAKDPNDRPTAAELAAWTFSDRPAGRATGLTPARRSIRRRLLAVLAGLLVAGAAVTAGVFIDQAGNTPLIPPEVLRIHQPPHSAPPSRVTSPPTHPVATPTATPTATPKATSKATPKAAPKAAPTAGVTKPATSGRTTAPHVPSAKPPRVTPHPSRTSPALAPAPTAGDQGQNNQD
ncbi:protein kinase [Kribbella sp. NPDC004875]|uniref:protein kinase domain-containing protein n=1 Tax=Kribbella sp. NPDC004875 TaxID=3364107 RepID=UPI00368BAFC9